MASETDDNKIVEKIENKRVDIATQLESDKETLLRESKDNNLKTEELEEQVRRVEDTLKGAYKKHNHEIVDIEKELKKEVRQREIAEREAEESDKRYQTFKNRLIRWGVFSFSVILLSAFIWLHQFFLDWSWVAAHKNNTIIRIASELTVVFLVLNIPKPRLWKT
jgi:cation transport ATPase